MSAPQISKEFWEDFEWVKKNYIKLQKRFKNIWVAIADKKIISHGESLEEVESKAEALLGKNDFVTIYIESGAAIY